MRDRLEHAERCAATLKRELSDLGFATTATLGATELDYLSLGRQLSTLRMMLSEAQDKIREGKGRDPAPSIYNGLAVQPRQPQLVCAIITVSAWKAVRGVEAPHTSKLVKGAAADIWAASHQATEGVDWQNWILKAKQPTALDSSNGSVAPWFVQKWHEYSERKAN